MSYSARDSDLSSSLYRSRSFNCLSNGVPPTRGIPSSPVPRLQKGTSIDSDRTLDEVMEHMESLLHTGSEHGMDSLSYSHSRSPARNGFDGTTNLRETDSGIGNTWSSPFKRSTGRYSSLQLPQYTENAVPSLHSTRSQRSDHSPLWPGRNLETLTRDLQQALDESEARRSLLTHKLKDARDTIQMQSQKLTEIEQTSKDNGMELISLRCKEEELRRQVNQLERQKQDLHSQRVEAMRCQDQLQERMDSLDMELKSFRSQYTMLQAEQQKRQDLLDTTNSTVAALEEENRKLVKSKHELACEVTTLRETMELSRSRTEWMEQQNKELKQEVDRAREENHSLALQSKEASLRVTEVKGTNQQLRAEVTQGQQTLMQAKEENMRLLRQLESLQANLADTKADLASVASDKERFFQEKLDLHQKVQTLTHDKDCISQVKASIETQLSELHEELAQETLQKDQAIEEKRAMDAELAATKKVSEVLSQELANTKSALEKTQEQLSGLDQGKKLAQQQNALNQQEIKALESQLSNLKKAMESMQKDQSQDKRGQEEQTNKLKEEIKQLRSTRNQLETKCHEAEAKLKQSEQNLKDHSAVMQSEMETWRGNCEKLAASLSKKDMELQGQTKKAQELQDEMNMLKVNQDKFQGQYEELMEAREQALRLQEENRRLLQERGENQQVIQLLEMQKSILQKASEGSLSKVQEREELQHRYHQLSGEHQALKEKCEELEKIRDSLIKEKEERLAEGDLFLGKQDTSGLETRCQELEKQNSQLREVNDTMTKQLRKLEKENEGRQKFGDSSRAERKPGDADLNAVQQQYENLEQQYGQLLSPHSQQLAAIHREKKALEAKVAMLESDLRLSESGKKKAEEKIAKLESDIQNARATSCDGSCVNQLSTLKTQLSNLETQLSDSKSKATKSTALKKQVADLQTQLADARSKVTQLPTLQKQVVDLQTQLAGARTKLTQVGSLQKQVADLEKQLNEARSLRQQLEGQIHSQKEQSLDDVGEELTHMRTELQKLLEVIQVKDQSIEDLESQLKECRHNLSEREKEVSDMKIKEKMQTSVLSEDKGNEVQGSQNDRLASLQKEKLEPNECDGDVEDCTLSQSTNSQINNLDFDFDDYDDDLNVIHDSNKNGANVLANNPMDRELSQNTDSDCNIAKASVTQTTEVSDTLDCDNIENENIGGTSTNKLVPVSFNNLKNIPKATFSARLPTFRRSDKNDATDGLQLKKVGRTFSSQDPSSAMFRLSGQSGARSRLTDSKTGRPRPPVSS